MTELKQHNRYCLTVPGMVWTNYQTWRTWDEVCAPKLFTQDDLMHGVVDAEYERLKRFPDADPENPIDPAKLEIKPILIQFLEQVDSPADPG